MTLMISDREFLNKELLNIICLVLSGLSYKHGSVHLCCMQSLSFIWNPVPPPGTEPGSPALGARSLSYCTTRKVPIKELLILLHSDFWG